MKKIALLFSFGMLLSSCYNGFDVVVKQPNGIILKYKCENGRDTMNSTRYAYFGSILLSQESHVNGIKEGSKINYFKNGTIRETGNYSKNKANGIFKEFSENGILLKKILYMDNIPILYEILMINTDLQLSRRRVYSLIDNSRTLAGELYMDMVGESIDVGNVKSTIDSSCIGTYKGLFADMQIDDTINLNHEALITLEFTIPLTLTKPEIIVGEVDESLAFIDTLFYAKPDSVYDTLSFVFTPKKPGNHYLVGKLTNLELFNDDVLFFNGFFVR